jgi:hypothetical protein
MVVTKEAEMGEEVAEANDDAGLGTRSALAILWKGADIRRPRRGRQ